MKYSGHRKLICELSKLNAFILLGYLTNTLASILVYKFRPKRTGFHVYAEYTRPQLTFLALHPWCIPSSWNDPDRVMMQCVHNNKKWENGEHFNFVLFVKCAISNRKQKRDHNSQISSCPHIIYMHPALAGNFIKNLT